MILIGIIVVSFFLLIAILNFVMGFQEGISEIAEETVPDYWIEIVEGVKALFPPGIGDVEFLGICGYLSTYLWMIYDTVFSIWSNLFSLLGYLLGYKVFKK